MENKVTDEQPEGLIAGRRRRRGQAPVDVVQVNAKDGLDVAEGKIRIWLRNLLFSLGISPVFRAYVFLGSVLAILGFLLYNESLTHQLREQEKSRVGLRCTALSVFVAGLPQKKRA